MIPDISAATYRRLCIQGYGGFSKAELGALHFGIRFPYAVCAVTAVIGLSLASIPILTALMGIAFLGVILPNHPFDYLYNSGLRYLLNAPKMPPRSAQNKFACGLATAWLGITLVLFRFGLNNWAMIWGSMMIVVSGLVSITDICIPSMMYNRMTGQKTAQTNLF